ncbi:MAG: hypothetical protein WC876_03390 [Candidatus Thermoplasmatota archaeon]|jgi:hypothetical protein
MTRQCTSNALANPNRPPRQALAHAREYRLVPAQGFSWRDLAPLGAADEVRVFFELLDCHEVEVWQGDDGLLRIYAQARNLEFPGESG